MGLQIGQRLHNGKYTIEKELGRGRFAITYLARNQDGDRRVLKVLNPQVLLDLEAIKKSERTRLEDQFWREAVNLARCNGSPHIVRVYTPFKEDGVAYLPMEYIDSRSLAERSEKILPEETALKYIRQIGEALVLVHQIELVHCDIRPDNIFLRSRGGVQEAVLADFGLALDFGTRLTSTRERERMDGFSALELYERNFPIGAYTDVYSLAATLYDLVTGVPPMGVKQRATANLNSPQTQNPLVSEITNNAILKGLEILSDNRPVSVQNWLAMWLIIEPKSPVKKSPKISNWQTFWMGVAAIVAIIAVVVAALGIIPGWLTYLDIKPTPKSSVKSEDSPK
jgi:eukaryotic-like serine/threonine-protein kinase